MSAMIYRENRRRMQGLYSTLGPQEFFRQRLLWLAANGKRTRFDQTVAKVRELGLDIEIPDF
jgi:hypothetical protein